MIALMMMGAIAIYIAILFIALWLLPKVIKIRHIKRVIFIVWFLIPTWDVIIGYPIYKFLCATQAGVKIYKTVDNVEGFYVGEWSKDGYRKVPPLPYQGYKFLDYKEVEKNKPTGKYFRTSWVDANTTQECIQIGSFDKERYSDVLGQGKCLVKEEIAESEVSELWSQKRKVEHYLLFYLNIYSVEITIEDRKNHEKYFIVQDYFVDDSWVTGALNFVSGNKFKSNCFEDIIVSTSSGFIISDKFVLETLQPKGEK